MITCSIVEIDPKIIEEIAKCKLFVALVVMLETEYLEGVAHHRHIKELGWKPRFTRRYKIGDVIPLELVGEAREDMEANFVVVFQANGSLLWGNLLQF